jgi:hypothetical protein
MGNEIQLYTNDGRVMFISASFLTAVQYSELAQPFLPLDPNKKKNSVA